MRARILALALLALAAAPASSYEFRRYAGVPVRWGGAKAVLYHDPATIATPVLVAQLLAAMDTWSSVPGSKFRYVHGLESPSADLRDVRNGNSDVYFDLLSGQTYSVTFSRMNEGVNVVERDIVFNQAHSWTTGATNQPGGPADFHTVALHELGHTLGLEHEPTRTAVMNPDWDPAYARHALLPDDLAGARYLYPDGSIPSGPDLAVDSVSYSPIGAQPGETITLLYLIANQGNLSSGPFGVRLQLSGGPGPSPADPELDSWDEVALGAGISLTRSRDLVLPTNLPPGTYHAAVLLDPTSQVTDVDRSNNAGLSAVAIRIERDAIEVPSVCRVEGALGPSGRDGYRLELMAGTRLKIRAEQKQGALTLELREPDGITRLAVSGVDRKVKLKPEIRESGTHLLRVDSQIFETRGYEIRMRTKKLTLKDEVTVTGPVSIPILLTAGSRVSIRVKGRDGFQPVASIPGLDLAAVTSTSGRKVKLETFIVTQTETRTLVIGGVGGAAGTASYKIKILPPETGPFIVR